MREAELKHCRVAMLATLGCIVQDVMKFPGVEKVYAGDIKLTKLHDAAVEQGTMGQMLFWLTGFEIFGTAAVIQMLQVILPAEAPALESHAHCTALPLSHAMHPLGARRGCST